MRSHRQRRSRRRRTDGEPMTTRRFRATWIVIALACAAAAGFFPASASVAAAQASARQPRAVEPRDLANDERLGGHTLARHVGKSDQDLAARLQREPGISAASTYTDSATAAAVVGAALAASRSRLDTWLARRGGRPNLVLRYTQT